MFLLCLKIKNNFFEMLISLSQVRSSGASGWLAALYFKYLYWNWKYTNTKYWNNSGNMEVGPATSAVSKLLFKDKYLFAINRFH